MSTVQIKDLVKRFGGMLAVDGLGLTIESGEIVSFLGPSGCGKTTTLRCIAGLERPTGGEVWIGDGCVAGAGRWVPPERRNIGMVFQSYALWPHMTVYRNVALGLELRRRPKDEIRERVRRVLELVELTGLDQRYPSQMSGGQQQRVAVARSLVIEPQVLLFDEPLSNLDARVRERVRLELRELLKRLGITSIYVTHDQAEAMAIADRIVVMNHGRIEQEGDARALYERPATRFVAEFVGWVNFIRARVSPPGRYGTLTAFESADGLTVVSTTAATGGEGVVGFRPEHVRLVDQPGPPNTWPARVEKHVYLGRAGESHARIGPWLIRVPDLDVPAGREVLLHVPPERVFYFPGGEA